MGTQGKLKLAAARLLGRYPLHGAILAQWRPVADGSVGTVAVGVKGPSVRLKFAPEFVEGLPLEELTGVLVHEVNHVLGGHIWMDPRNYPDREAFTAAIETTANEYVREPLPGRPCLLANFPSLPADEDAHTRYKRLESGGLGDEDKDEDAKDGEGRSDGGANDGGNQEEAAGDDAEQDGEDAEGRGTTADGQDGSGKGENASAKPSPEPVDNHGAWEELRKNRAMAESVLAATVATALGRLSEEQRGACSEQALVQAHGIAGVTATTRLEKTEGRSQVDWRSALRRYAGRTLSRRPTFAKPPRRFPDLLGIVPGHSWQGEKPCVMAVIDTSGSIADRTLQEISEELGAMAKRFEVVVVECDSKILDSYPFRPLAQVRGRGGTDFRPPLEPAFLRKNRADLVVYFTDGFGPAPEKPPRVPVAWCLTEGGTKPAAWGHEIRMGEPKGD